MKKYIIPVEWTVFGEVILCADTLAEAKKLVAGTDPPFVLEYLDSSLKVASPCDAQVFDDKTDGYIPCKR